MPRLVVCLHKSKRKSLSSFFFLSQVKQPTYMHNHRGGDRQILGPQRSVSLVESWSSRFCERLCLQNRQTKNKVPGSRGRTTPAAGLWPLYILTLTMHRTHTRMSTQREKEKKLLPKILMNSEDKFGLKGREFFSPVLKGKSRHEQQSTHHLLQSIIGRTQLKDPAGPNLSTAAKRRLEAQAHSHWKDFQRAL